MTATKHIPTLRIYSMDESELKEFLVDKTLSQICSTNEDKSNGIIINKCSKEEEESKCVHKHINKQKDVKNDTEYE